MEDLLRIATAAAQKAGATIMELYDSNEYTLKDDGSPVTIADKKSNEVLYSCLAETNIPILSEESVEIASYPERLWIIDPLDGTKDFIKKNGDFAVMIGLLERGIPVLGVIYAPAHDTLYTARKGHGAFMTRNNATHRMNVSTQKERPRFIRSISNFTPRMEQLANALSAELIPRGSIGVKSGVIANGEGEFFAYFGEFAAWDICAPEVIVTEAGGVVSNNLGQPLAYGRSDHHIPHGIIFSNAACAQDVRSAVQAILAEP